MASLLNLTLGDLDDNEKITLTKRFNEKMNRNSIESDSMLNEISVAFDDGSANLSAAMERELKSKITDTMNGIDGIRGDSIDLIEDAIEYYRKKRNKRFSDAAETLGEAFDKAFKDYNISNNAIETNRINVFLEEVKAPEVAEAIVTLRVDSEVEDLRLTNPQYEELGIERATLKANDNTPYLRPSRRDLNSYISYLEKHLEFKINRGSDFHAALAEELRSVASEIMAAARARKTKAENSAE